MGDTISLREHINKIYEWVVKKLPSHSRPLSLEDFPPDIRKSLEFVGEGLFHQKEPLLAKAYVVRDPILILDPRLKSLFETPVVYGENVSSSRVSFNIEHKEPVVHILFPLPYKKIRFIHGEASKGMNYYAKGSSEMELLLREVLKEMEEEKLPTPKSIRAATVLVKKEGGKLVPNLEDGFPALLLSIVLDRDSDPQKQLHHTLEKSLWRLRRLLEMHHF